MQLTVSKRPLLDAAKERICLQIDDERDSRSALDMPYDFSGIQAVFDDGSTQEGGVRSLQARPQDRANWQALYSGAQTAIITGAPQGTIMPMRVQDNANMQTSPMQVLQILSALLARNSHILFYGATLKAQVRDLTDVAAIEAFNFKTVDWPTT